MANVVGLNSLKKSSGNNPNDDGSNHLYVGGTSDSQGGGSGLSVIGGGDESNAPLDSVFAQAIASTREAAASGDSSSLPDTTNRVITFYQNGFTINDGPFRLLSENQEFVADLQRGVVPRELEAEAASSSNKIGISVIDKRSEVYTPPAYTAFSGAGQSMGSTSTSPAGVINNTGSSELPTVDESKKTVRIQVKLVNGKRFKVVLHPSHVVQDLVTLISAEDSSINNYILLAGFPPTPLTDMAQTIDEAKLAGASVTQKLA